ncbi:glycosyl transferase group 1 [Bacteroides sp. CAG:927]|nr:glycosyl transferase group 1 [Bacteroides sp. CAG:927]
MKVLHVFTLLTTPESFFYGQFGYLAEHGHEIHLVTDDEEDIEFSRRNHIIYHRIPIIRAISPMGDIGTIKKLMQLIRREKYDAVFGHTPKGAMVAMIAAKLAGVKTRVYYRHGLIYTTAKGLKRSILKTVERLTAACATHIVNVSPSLSKLAVKDHLNSSRKQIVIGLGTCGGIDTIDIFNPTKVSQEKVSALRHALGVPDNAYVVGFCGRLCRDKGIIELIEGFRIFQQAHPDIVSCLLLVGPYDARDILPPQVKDEIEENHSIVAPGSVSHHFLPDYYSLMDVFVFPSYREGFGMTVLEASAMRIPVLVSRSHGCVDSIRENITGCYIDITSQSIASGLSDMLVPQLRQRLGNAGRDFVTENFERTRMWPRILDLYKQFFLNETV